MTGMYEIPKHPQDADEDDEDFYDQVADAIEHSPKVRAAILRSLATNRARNGHGTTSSVKGQGR